MQASGRRIIAPFVVSLSTEAGNAQPRRQSALTGLGCDSKNTLIVAVMDTNVALIVVGVYLGIRNGHTAKGCVANGPDGLELQMQDNKTNLLLENATDAKPGRLGKLTSAKKKKPPGACVNGTNIHANRLSRIESSLLFLVATTSPTL